MDLSCVSIQPTAGRRRLLLPLAALCALAMGCGKDPVSSEPARSFTNVAYGTDPAQVMDVVLPAGRDGATTVVVFIHGGGWSGGDKSVFTPTDLQYFADRGYACVNINYRLASSARNIHDPILSEDVSAAIDFVVGQADEYKVSPNRFALVGHSAGAHLALLAAYKYNALGRIKAVASLAGPTDLTDPVFLALPTARATLENYLGVTQAAAPARWTGASPLYVATSSSAPTILMHGQLDFLVPYASQASALDTKLTTLGVPHEYHLFPTYNHDLGYALIFHFPAQQIWDPIIAWFGTYAAATR